MKPKSAKTPWDFGTATAQPRSGAASGCAAPSDLEVAISQNLHICRKMKGSDIAHIAAMGTFGESMMLEMERLLPSHVAQHNAAGELQPPPNNPK